MRALRKTVPGLVVLALFAVSCAPATPSPKAAAEAHQMPGALHWMRTAAEYQAITTQTYKAALEAAARLGAGRPAGSWGVSVDADETIIDNSGYEVELFRAGVAHTEELWKAWVARRQRTAVPGAATFLAGVRKLGGRVAVVTNTAQSLCGDVAANLDALKLEHDLLICRADANASDSRKEARWKAIADGTARPDLGKVELLVWVGDNIQDFPDQGQSLRGKDESAFGDFGVRFFALPNPVYGTWQKVAPR